MQQPHTWQKTIPALGLLVVFSLLVFNLTARPVAAAEMVITSNFDTVADDGVCTLREAIIAANTDTASGAKPGECKAGSGADTITFFVDATYTLSSQLPAVTSNITISGNGAANTIIEASTCEPNTTPGGCTPAPYRVMEVGAAGVLLLDGVTVRHGYIDGMAASSVGGAGIYNAGALAVINSTFANNRAYNAGGGGIRSIGPLVINKSTFSGNLGFTGGGIGHTGSPLSVTDSTFADNFGMTGGAISADDVTITDSTIADNRSQYAGGISGKVVTVANSTISGNAANFGTGYIGGIAGTTVNVISSTISGNSDSNLAGGISASTVNVTDSTIADNTSTGGTGGVVGTAVTVTDSTISGNTGGAGGGVYTGDGSSITNSTISGNSATYYGGAVYSTGTLTLTNTTVTGNDSADIGGGIYTSGTVTLARNLISGNSATNGGAEIYNDFGTVTAGDNNVFGSDALTTAQAFEGFSADVSDLMATSDAGNFPLADILNTTLADNGGTTMTHALTTGSPAIDIADAADCAGPPVDGHDQRGEPRPLGPKCDAGSFEAPAPSLGSVEIIKAANPANDQVFSFTDNIAAPNSFTLQDPSNDTKLFSNVAAGTYTITELDLPGWPLAAIDCNVDVGDVTYDPDGNVPFTFTLAAGVDATCTLASYQCQPGTYDFGGASCRAAEKGHFVPTVEATEATPCSPGSYQPEEGQTSCLLADPGYYVNVSGSDQQFMCPAGTTSGPGATFCTPTGTNFTYLPVVMRP